MPISLIAVSRPARCDHEEYPRSLGYTASSDLTAGLPHGVTYGKWGYVARAEMSSLRDNQ
jgi:hypothetical protein